MKLENRNGLRIVYPAEGHVLAKKDKSVLIQGEIYLGKFDSEENYIELTQEEADLLREELAKKAEEEHKKRNEEHNLARNPQEEAK